MKVSTTDTASCPTTCVELVNTCVQPARFAVVPIAVESKIGYAMRRISPSVVRLLACLGIRRA